VADGSEAQRTRWTWIVSGVAGLAVGAFLAFRFLNPIVAAFLVIFAATVLGMAALARDWDRHPDFEQRELVRARKRAAKWERGQSARDKDRARWEAQKARQARKTAQ
jgi:hypothetical protein